MSEKELNFDDSNEDQGFGFIMPSSEADRKIIMDAMQEISHAKSRMEGEQTFVKEAISELVDKFKIPKRLLNRFAKAYHRQTYTEELGQNSDFEHMVEILVKTQD